MDFKDFSEGACRCVYFGMEEAVRSGTSVMEVPHLLLGIIRQESELIAFLLNRFDTPMELAESIKECLGRPVTRREFVFSDELKHVLNNAVKLAETKSRKEILSQHLLLAILQSDSDSARILRGRGVGAWKVHHTLLGP